MLSTSLKGWALKFWLHTEIDPDLNTYCSASEWYKNMAAEDIFIDHSSKYTIHSFSAQPILLAQIVNKSSWPPLPKALLGSIVFLCLRSPISLKRQVNLEQLMLSCGYKLCRRCLPVWQCIHTNSINISPENSVNSMKSKGWFPLSRIFRADGIDHLAILQKSLDRATFLYIFMRKVRLNGARAWITIVHVRKFYKL